MSERSIHKPLSWPRWTKRAVMIAADIFMCIVSVVIAFYLRLGEWPGATSALGFAALVAPLVAIPVFVSLDLYRTIFRHVGVAAVWAVCRAVIGYGLVYAAIFTLWSVPGVPRTVGLIQPGLLLLLVIATRTFFARLVAGPPNSAFRQSKANMLIYGAGSAGRQLAAALTRSKEVAIVGFIDDDPALHGNVLEGFQIYAPRAMGRVIRDKSVSDVLLAIPSATRVRQHEILTAARQFGVGVRMLPGVTELASGTIVASDLREVDIVDLLGREAVKPDPVLLTRDITDKTVIVTGAGGSIGSDLCRQIMRLAPKQLILVENSEFALYRIHAEITAAANGRLADVTPVLASVRDPESMDAVFKNWKPETVYHAAAYKHVPLVEENPGEGVANNVEGTRVVAEAALRHAASNFVLISTDKAVRPTNIMGASKRVAELTLQALAAESGSTRFSMVRFGNVLGSSGSVVPLFRSQIAHGGPVTVTDPEMTRYFMTIPEAAELVIQAGAMARGGEVFLLDMGNPVKIVDLARAMIELSGLRVRDSDVPDGDIEISFTGLRPGEKLYEELLIEDGATATQHTRIFMANEPFFEREKLELLVSNLNNAVGSRERGQIVSSLQKLVAGFLPLVGESGAGSSRDAQHSVSATTCESQRAL